MAESSHLVVYRSVWLLAVVALIGVGAPYFGDPGTMMPLAAHGRDSSMNSGLDRALGEPGQAEKIRGYIAQLPAGRPIGVLFPTEDVGAAYIACSVAYLAWPRPATMIRNPTPSRALVEDLRRRYCATAWCYLPPPPDSHEIIRFGGGLAVAPNKGQEQ